jgi:hypothetical protein
MPQHTIPGKIVTISTGSAEMGFLDLWGIKSFDFARHIIEIACNEFLRGDLGGSPRVRFHGRLAVELGQHLPWS